MIKVITYGTFDLLHYGHIKLLERAKALGDYLVVGVTSDDYDVGRGKINNKQSLIERVEAIKNTGLADEIIIEEYEGQKIDDICRMNIDIFTVGSDWVGKFDYLNDYCKVVYLERTAGVSSTEIRNHNCIRLGVVGETDYILKFFNESKFVNGILVSSVLTKNNKIQQELKDDVLLFDEYDKMLDSVDAVYIISSPRNHFKQIKTALLKRKHVLCESPIVISSHDYCELKAIAKENNVFLCEALRTAYTTSYDRLKLLIKSGAIGKVVSVDATCTSLRDISAFKDKTDAWNSICMWGPTAMLPVFDILGTDYNSKQIISMMSNGIKEYDVFSKINFNYYTATATIKIANGVKSEGELIISGTNGYVYVPAPWWKTDYFEIRYEDSSKNKRYFYQLDGEGIRYELVAFENIIHNNKYRDYISDKVSSTIISVIDDYYNGMDVVLLK